MISNRIFQRLENDDDRGFAPAKSLQREEKTSQVRISDARQIRTNPAASASNGLLIPSAAKIPPCT
jgi:hypothetical protein